jgi:hypothetical protein
MSEKTPKGTPPQQVPTPPKFPADRIERGEKPITPVIRNK